MINKIAIVIIITILLSSFCNALDVPYSENPVYSKQNQISNFLCSIPPDSSSIPLETNCWIWHNNENIYISWEADTDENFMIGKYSPNDVSAQADQLCVQIITDQINCYAYGFIAYPLENKSDFVRSTSHSLDYDWNSTYEYSSTNQNSKWLVVMKIPLKDLRFNGKPPYKWKIILSRYFKNDDKYYTTPFLTTQMGKDYFRKALDITINKEIRRDRNLYLRPYSIVKSDLLENDTKFNFDSFGLDLSIKPSSSSKLKFTYNPDFSDVPIDDESNNFNSKYASFYAENRYFFIKDLNALGVSSTSFYSRQIVQPDYAVKFTGRNDNLTYGVLSTKVKQVALGNVIVDSNDIYNIIAIKPSSDNFNFQFTLLNRMNKNYHNEVLHLKPNWEFRKDQYLWVDLNLSTKKTLENGTNNGYFAIAGYDYKNDDFNFAISATQMSKDYAVDMGKIYEDDYYGWNLNSYLIKEFSNIHLRSITSNINASEEIDNHTSELLERYAHFDLNLITNYHLDFEIDCVSVKELWSEKYFDKYQISFQSTWSKPKLFNAFVGINYVNYIIYVLNNDYQGRYLQLGLRGIINKYVSYSIIVDNMTYFDVPNVDYIDDNYWLANLDFSLSLSNSLDLTSGIRFNNYEYAYTDSDDVYHDYSQHVGLFSNLRWQFMKHNYIYLGYNSANNEINDISEYSHQQAYLKISYSF
ncbi:MAG: hypothetical protein KAS53_12445 [Candidatus Cloacimonetes bacterium]|nr:hypothetical protein [Candidatus Cloacimonadota bacterium]